MYGLPTYQDPYNIRRPMSMKKAPQTRTSHNQFLNRSGDQGGKVGTFHCGQSLPAAIEMLFIAFATVRSKIKARNPVMRTNNAETRSIGLRCYSRAVSTVSPGIPQLSILSLPSADTCTPMKLRFLIN